MRSGVLRLRASMLAALLTITASVPARSPRPPAGVDVDEIRAVALASTPPSPCLALTSTDAVVLVARAPLEALAAATPPRWATEAERQALIAGKRAQAVLGALAPEPDGGGCFAVATPPAADALSLFLDAIERGAATVIDRRTGQAVASVNVRYQGMRCGPRCGRGTISVALASGGFPFMVVDWWVS